MRLTEQQAVKLKLIQPGKGQEGAVSKKRRSIIDNLAEINSAQVSIQQLPKGYRVEIKGVTAPSWNTVLRWDMRREFASYNKAWHRLLQDAAMECGLHRQHSTDKYFVRILAKRKRLLDYDNVCVKQIIDACCRCGIIKDDSPEYIAGYSVEQEKAKDVGVRVLFERLD